MSRYVRATGERIDRLLMPSDNEAMSIAATSEADILQRAIGPENGSMPAEVARMLVDVDFAPGDHEQMRDLAAKARAGTLSSDERVAVENYERVNNLLGILRSRVRRSLEAHGQESA